MKSQRERERSLTAAGQAVFNTILGVECAVEAQQAFPLVGVCVYLQTTDSSAKTEPYTTPPMEHYTHKHKMSLQEKKNTYLWETGHLYTGTDRLLL